MSTTTLTTGARVEHRDGVALVLINVTGRAQNTLTPELGRELERAIVELEADDRVNVIVLASGKTDSFMAGADVEQLHSLDSADDATELAQDAQQLTKRVETCAKPVVAAIQGPCLGAGLELALACRQRIAADDDITQLGTPEVQLGLIPGAGGTQRLPRLIGLVDALELITTGNPVSPAKARRMGLVEEVVHPEILLDTAIERARRLAAAGAEDSGAGLVERASTLALEGNPLGRRVVFKKATDRVLAQTKGTMPAPVEAIEVMRIGFEEGMDEGLVAEARTFGELAVSPVSRNLRALFLAREAAKNKRYTDASPQKVAKVAVVGAGLMGAGIAEVTANKAGLPVRLRDIDHEKVRAGLHSISGILRDIRRFDRDACREILGRITATTDSEGLQDVDLAIEAVIEDIQVKTKVFEQLEEALPPRAVIATNTSALPLQQLAQSLSRPERLVGMHYFSPVGKVPLLEVVEGASTDPAALATAIDIGRRQGKTVIVVGDEPGFYTSRILGRYLNEAAHQAAEGVPVDVIDEALEQNGFAVGPFRLLDDVGIDIAHEIAGTLHDAFGDRLKPGALLQRLVDDGRQGAKNGHGIYAYTDSGDGGYERTGAVDPAVTHLIAVERPLDRDADDIADRCIMQMADEAVRCLADSVVRSPTDGDLGAVLGLGFPPHLGGPFRYLDDRGVALVAERMQALADREGPRWRPADLLVSKGEAGESFHGP